MKFLFFQNNAANTLWGPDPAPPQASGKGAADGIVGFSTGSHHANTTCLLIFEDIYSFDAFSELPFFFFFPSKERQCKKRPNKYLMPAHGHISCSWRLGCSCRGQRSTRDVASRCGVCRAGSGSSRCTGGMRTLLCHATGPRPPARWCTVSPAGACQRKSMC